MFIKDLVNAVYDGENKRKTKKSRKVDKTYKIIDEWMIDKTWYLFVILENKWIQQKTCW